MTPVGHPGPDALLDLVEGGGEPAVRTHVASCAACTERVAEAAEGLGLALSHDVPEPSPFYWQAFRRQVGARLVDERAARRWRGWLMPAFATLGLLVALPATRVSPPPPGSPLVPAWSALPAAEEDEGLPVLEALASDPTLELDTREGRGIAEVLSEVSEEDAAALVAALPTGGGAS
jgi:hypothetical protein